MALFSRKVRGSISSKEVRIQHLQRVKTVGDEFLDILFCSIEMLLVV